MKDQTLQKTGNSDNPYRWWALAGICMLAFTAYLDATMVNTALPFIKEALNLTVIKLQWIANIFPIILSMTMIVVGKLADYFGRKKVFYIGAVLFGVASIFAGFSNQMELLVLFRGIQALGASTVFISSASLLQPIFGENERLRAVSIFGAVTGFGLLVGPFCGGVLVALLSWRWVFWVNVPIIAIGTSLCLFALKGKVNVDRETDVHMDWIGLILLLFGLGALMIGIISGAQTNWKEAWAIIVLVAGCITLITLVIVDGKKQHPLLDLPIFKNKLIILSALSCLLAGVACSVYMFYDPLYLRIVLKLAPFHIGILLAIIPAAQSCIAIVFSKLTRVLGLANLFLISISAAFAGAILHHFLGNSTPLYYLIFPFFLLGINWGLSNTAMVTAINKEVQPHQIGQAIGTIGSLWNMSGAIILAISTAIFHSINKQATFMPAFEGVIYFNIAFAFLVLVAAIWVWTLLRKKSKTV